MPTTRLRVHPSFLWLSSLALTASLSCSDRANDCKVLLHCAGSSAGGAEAEGGAPGTGGTASSGGSAGGGGASSGGSAERGGAPAGGKAGRGGASGASSGGAATGGDTSDGGSGDTAGGGGSDNEGGESGSTGEAGAAGAGGSGPPPCDGTAAPSAEPCVVDEAYAVFVAPSGSDTADGSRATPLQSLSRGIELAVAQKKSVIACNAIYAAPVAITASLKLYGGFSCPGTSDAWSYVPTGVARVAPSTRGAALSIRGVTAPVEIHDFEFQSLEGAAAGESSIAAFVVDSPNVTLRRVRLIAGAGKAGADGKTAAFTFAEVSALQGNAGGTAGGLAKSCTCPDGAATSGGPGGSPPDQNGGSGGPDPGTPGGEGGDPALACNNGGGGSDGAPGAAGANAPGAATLGKLSATAWTPGAGANATPGAPGQGGGGGAGNPAGGGGGGGCGGCAGRGGSAGKGGGASIALVAIGSPVMLDGGTLITAAAGNGGKGSAGQPGQATFGGGGDGSGQGDPGCDGGNGGPGGNGGSGGGGAGGISVGVLFQGVSPTLGATTTVTFGTPGKAGAGGTPGVNNGVAGVARATMAW